MAFKSYVPRLKLLFAIGCLCLTSLSAADPVIPEDKVAATVDGEPIPENLIQVFQKNGSEALAQEPGGNEKIKHLRDAIITEQVDRLLILQETKKRGIAPTTAQVDALENTTRDYYGGDEAYGAFLRQNGFSREEYRDYVLKSGEAGKVLSAAFAQEIKVTPEEIEKQYLEQKPKGAFQVPERASAAHILLKTQPGFLKRIVTFNKNIAPGEAVDRAIAEEMDRRKKLAEAVRTQAMVPGGDFTALAQKYSEDFGTREKGGDLGQFVKGTHPLELDEAIFKTPPGEIGPVVKTYLGFHIFKTLLHTPAGTQTLEQATPFIEADLLRTKQAARLRIFLEEARKNATIVIKTSQ